MDSTHHFVALVSKEGRHYTIEFPDAPGCQTFAERKADIYATAKEAIEGWLEAHLLSERVPPRPQLHRKARHGEERVHIAIEPKLLLAVR